MISLRLTTLSSLSIQLYVESGWPCGLTVIDVADAYVSAAAISRWLPGHGMLRIQRKQETVLCHSLATEEMYNCIAQLHCFTGYDTNSGLQAFIVRQSCKELQRQLASCGDERSRS